MEYVTLYHNMPMPMVGIGTFLMTPDEAEASVRSALEAGYRLIDTANAYVNEKAVGRAIRASGLDRKEIFLETKLWPSFYEQQDAVDKTLERLGTDSIDLLLLHQPAGNYVAGYRLMEQAYREGKVKAIGLSKWSRSWPFARSGPLCCRQKSTPIPKKKNTKPFCKKRALPSKPGIRWAMGTRRCGKSRCLPSWLKSMARATARSSCAGTSRRAMW